MASTDLKVSELVINELSTSDYETMLDGNGNIPAFANQLAFTTDDPTVYIDNVLSKTSTNPVQNKIITTVIESKFDTYKPSSYDANVLYDAGLYLVSNGSNLPSSNQYGSLLTLPYSGLTGNTQTNYESQLYLPNGDDPTSPNSLFYRNSKLDTWNDWKEVVNTTDAQIIKGNKQYTQINYLRGTCSDSSSISAALNVTLPGFILIPGCEIEVTFTYGLDNLAGTMDVNLTGPKDIRRKYYNSYTTCQWAAGDTVRFRYENGFWWQISFYDCTSATNACLAENAKVADSIKNGITYRTSSSATSTWTGASALTLSSYYTDLYTAQTVGGKKTFSAGLHTSAGQYLTIGGRTVAASSSSTDGIQLGTSSYKTTLNGSAIKIANNIININDNVSLQYNSTTNSLDFIFN